MLEKKARAIVETLDKAGFQAVFAGGCVRDMFLGREPKDYDIATSASPEQIEALFPKTLAIGKAFGVIGVVVDNHVFEVATFRTESGYLDGRRPGRVSFCEAREDAQRRDFTINGMFYDPLQDEVIDYVDGRDDLKKNIIRAIGNPGQRFREDHLRMLRAVRFSATLGFAIEKHTAEAISSMAARVAQVSAERIEQELTGILLESPRSGDGIEMLADLGLLETVLPEVYAMIGQEQPPQFHPEGDVFTHTVMMLNMLKHPSRVLAYATLLHDVGKPPTAKVGPGTDGALRIRFDGHDATGAKMAKKILKRLKFPVREREDICFIIGHHMQFMHVRDMRKSRLRAMVGRHTFQDEMELHRVDCLSSHGQLDNYEFLETFIRGMKNEPVLPPPLINGHDVLALGVPAGPQVGVLLHAVYEAQLEGAFTSRDDALVMLEGLVE